MLLSETVWTMTPRMTTRQVAGSIIRDELARQHWTQEKAATAMHMAKSTLARVLTGDETVQDLTLRQIEGLLGLPRRFLSLVIAGDVERIGQLGDMDADLRRHTLDALSEPGDTDVARSKQA